MSCSYSVVIPTFNRLASLKAVLAAVEAQAAAPEYEIVVVDDGSSDTTAAWLSTRSFARPHRVVVQDRRGPAAARNAGVRAAAGDTIAFLGDDTLPRPDWLAVHHRARMARQATGRLAVVGFSDWHPRIRITRFLQFLNTSGRQFGYARIDDPENVSFVFFYTSNLLLPRALLLENPFDETFPHAAWEDIELGYRLSQAGMKLIYVPEAVVYHDHPTSIRRFCARQEKSGCSGARFYRLHPEITFLGPSPEGIPAIPPRRPHLWRLARVLLCEHLPIDLPALWDEVLLYYYIRGLHAGWNDK